MIDRKYSEKRDFIRMKVNTPANVSVEEAGVTAEGVCNDLSGNGMLLTIDQKIPIDSELLVTLSSGSSDEPMLQARCTIARLQEAAEDKCLLGLEIQEILGEK
jgi:hypothetical protein